MCYPATKFRWQVHGRWGRIQVPPPSRPHLNFSFVTAFRVEKSRNKDKCS